MTVVGAKLGSSSCFEEAFDMYSLVYADQLFG